MAEMMNYIHCAKCLAGVGKHMPEWLAVGVNTDGRIEVRCERHGLVGVIGTADDKILAMRGVRKGWET